MKKIVFDVMNNDNGIYKAIKGAISFKLKNPNYKIALVGNKEIIESELAKSSNLIAEDAFEIIDSKNIIHLTSSPREALKTPSSMLDAFNYLDENDYDAILSSGDSGAFTTLSMLKIKRLNNVERIAFMPILPTLIGKHTLLLDAGANIETTAEYLNNWAILANHYYKLIFNTKNNPSIGLLNIGSEEYKGSVLNKEAYKLLKENKDINFYGFIEPKDAIEGKIDIILADGQSGNVFLKTLESSFLGFGKMLKDIIKTNFLTKLGGLLLKKRLKKMKDDFDYRNVGGAYIIGLNKVVVKAHGGSDEIAFENALNQIKNILDKETFMDELKKELSNINNDKIE
ncbi:Fatty acid/phospholipid synthesis protein [Metamycoplasma auris 15026]|uniref:Phosphate acyltransferase n=1 Tax=Metamycoplasma auris 15026 TaxID=1188233 RepID=N9TTB4_9BACT|nr:phosphate acyltransferase PlsX [Metamycoplasma auris]ENY69389.1 Fatty acid/phospholipid synthesis protein [Metamycoplasma auris 15026]